MTIYSLVTTMKKVSSSKNKSIFKENDTGEDVGLFDSSSAPSRVKDVISLKYIFHYGVSSTSLIYSGTIVKHNRPTLLQSLSELDANLDKVKKIAIDFRKSGSVDKDGVECVVQILRLFNEKKMTYVLAPFDSEVIQVLIDKRMLHSKNSAKDLTTALRLLSFSSAKFSGE